MNPHRYPLATVALIVFAAPAVTAAPACGSSAKVANDGGLPGPNPACAGQAPCASGCSVCEGTCVDLTGDPRNCGGCGSRCNPGLSCITNACELVCTSSEMMCGKVCSDVSSDGNNCGGCGRACSANDVCVSGSCVGPVAPTTLASGLHYPGGIAVDAEHVYFWATDSKSVTAIQRIRLDGGVVTEVGGDGKLGGTPLAVDATSVYWSGSDQLDKIPVGGGSVSTLTAMGAGAFAIDSEYVYFAGSDSYVDKVPLRGGSLVQVAPYSEVAGLGIAVDADFVYWATYGSLHRASLAGGSSTEIASSDAMYEYNVSPLAIDSQSAYWFLNYANNANLDVAPLAPEAAGPAVSVSTQLGTGPFLDLRADQGTVYFVGDGGVFKIAKGATTATLLAGNQKNPVSVTIDATSVYWVNQGDLLASDGSVMKMPR